MGHTNPFINTSHILPFDFYDELLVKYYGKMYEYTGVDYDSGVRIKVIAYIWNYVWYIVKVEVIK